jgi:hypothetical protein
VGGGTSADETVLFCPRGFERFVFLNNLCMMLDAAKCYMLVNPVGQLWRLQEHIQEVKKLSKLTNSSQYSGHEIDLP